MVNLKDFSECIFPFPRSALHAWTREEALHGSVVTLYKYLQNLIFLHCRHNTENLKQMFPEMELHGLSSNFHIHVSMSDLYIPTIGLPILLLGIYKSLTDTRMWKLGLRPCKFFFWEYINGIFVAVCNTRF